MKPATKAAGRWAVGKPVFGKPKTNAETWHKGTDTINGYRHAHRLAYRSYVMVALGRWGIALCVLVILISLYANFWRTIVALSLIHVVFWIAMIPAAWKADKRHKHEKRIVRPLAHQLGAILQHTDTQSINYKMWLNCPPDFMNVGITALLAPRWTPTQGDKDLATQKVNEVLPGVWSLEWHLEGRPTLYIRPASHPPKFVGYERLAKAIANAPMLKPVIGMGANGEIIDIDMANSMATCIAASIPRGGGKSIFLRPFIAHFARWNAWNMVFDQKQISQRWAEGHPNVDIIMGAAEWHDRLLWLFDETQRRYAAMHADPSYQPRLICVYLEELNTMMAILKEWWDEQPWQGEGKKSTVPPSVNKFNQMVWTARECGVYFWVVAQRFSVRSVGGNGDTRECFPLIFLARYSRQTWEMLSDVKPIPRTDPNIVGRMQMTYNGSGVSQEIQIVYLTDEQARAISTPVIQPSSEQWTEPVIVQPSSENPVGWTPVMLDGSLDAGHGTMDKLVTLREAPEYTHRSYDAMHKDRQQGRIRNGRAFPSAAPNKRGKFLQFRLGDLLEYYSDMIEGEAS